jgi:hypothetical protein
VGRTGCICLSLINVPEGADIKAQDLILRFPVRSYNFTIKMLCPARVVPRRTMKKEDTKIVTGDSVRLIIIAILLAAALLLWLSGR